MKQSEVKPGEVKPGEVKPGEVKPGEVKQGEVKQGEVKQGEVKQGEVKPGEVKPGEVKPEEVNRAEVTRQRPTIILTSTFSRKLTCAPHLLPVINQLIANNTMNRLVQFHPKMAASTIKDYKAIQAENYRFIETSDVLPFFATGRRNGQ